MDLLLVEKGLFPSRERAQTAILTGRVLVDGECVTKAGQQVLGDAQLEVRGEDLRYVGRGGLKLEKALDVFGVDPSGMVCLDIGASTGGFTDCLLQRGARRVYAVDVGYGQFAWSLRTDPRVILMERLNARNLTREHVAEDVDLAVIDVSFISVTLILPAISPLLGSDARVIVLVKPQFEAGREQVGKRGLVRDPAIHEAVLERVISCSRSLGFVPLGLTHSPIKGDTGNIEFLLILGWQVPDSEQVPPVSMEDIAEKVRLAHADL